MLNPSNKQEFDGHHCCVAPLMSPKMGGYSSLEVSNASNGSTTITNSSYDRRTPIEPPPKPGRHSSSGAQGEAPSKPHTGGDARWEAMNTATAREGRRVGLAQFRLLKRLGYGDIGSVYLVELRRTATHYAMKVMDKASLASRNKLLRAETEREILGLLDHPFLPTLYTHFETDKFCCLVMEFCSGGNLHSLRQKQPNKYFTEDAARFYASEVLLALEYLHMLGIVYRDLKPENVLVRDSGHIMLSDFDLSLRCSVSPTLVNAASFNVDPSEWAPPSSTSCIQPSTWIKKSRKPKPPSSDHPELMAEPTDVKSMSFVGTHEYLAPEIIRGEGHGSAVDWWTFGIFLYELLHGTTPFKGQGNRATLFNVVGQPLRFPDAQISPMARDLIRGLLVKEPQKRLAYKRGATEVKRHPFFEGVNWALVRCAAPPHVPEPFDSARYASKEPEPEPEPAELVKEEKGGNGRYQNFRENNLYDHKKDQENENDVVCDDDDVVCDDGNGNGNNADSHQSTEDDDSCYVDFEYF